MINQPMKKFNLHLISDSTGETVSSVSRAAVAQFDGVEAEEHIWSMIRTKSQIEKELYENTLVENSFGGQRYVSKTKKIF